MKRVEPTITHVIFNVNILQYCEHTEHLCHILSIVLLSDPFLVLEKIVFTLDSLCIAVFTVCYIPVSFYATGLNIYWEGVTGILSIKGTAASAKPDHKSHLYGYIEDAIYCIQCVL